MTRTSRSLATTWLARSIHIALLTLTVHSEARAQASAGEEAGAPGHGPSSKDAFSHNFTLAPHRYGLQGNLHFGLSQPLLFNGYNVAADLRFDRWLLEYSHGWDLELTKYDVIGEPFAGDSGARMSAEWTTGFGVGYTLIDDLAILVEAKAHNYRTDLGGESFEYTTVSVGPTLAYRLFLWKGLNVTTYLRFWPNVWDSVEGDTYEVGGQSFDPIDLGVFANLSLGWAFDLL